MSWWQDYGLNKINYKMIAYIFLVIIIIVSSGNYLYKSERTVSAVFCSILFILIFVFFGQRWFNNTSTSSTGIPIPKTWPPVINTCPDYLTYYNAGGVGTCIDLIGIVDSKYASIFTSWTTSDVANPPPSSASNKFFPAIYNAGKTDMTATCSNTTCTGTGDKQDSKYYLNQLCMQRGLTWEGITN
jgi:hypothetical protein